ncbi:restriction endonuclease subunit S [Elizabethkingia anophelis]|nr:restriction endonuclease subunit S [Elizabethkingia anophelis]MCT4177082.1 restriction endonuclease subunit S [Elizabethkingia anophelis]
MKRYETYKDSVIQSGEIPENWNQKPFSALFKLMNRKNFPNKELLSVYLDKGVIRFRDIEEKRTNVTSEDLTGYQLVKKGDFVINNQQAWRGSVGVSKYEGIISPAYLVLEFKENFHPNFANYLLRNISVVSKYLISSKGVGTIQRNLYWPSLKSVYLNYPSLSEQLAIASFLDNKTAKIDQTISIKEKEIELLKERRQILIQKAVTKGLDDKVKLKDSGVEWIGEIPEHWEVRKLKYCLSSKLKYGANESGVEYNEELPRYIRITDFGFDGNLSEEKKLSLTWGQGRDYLLKNGDILFARSGATVGKSYQFKTSMSSEKNYAFAGYLIKAEANEKIILSDFLYLYTNSNLFENWKSAIFNKATIENIGADKYSILNIVLPPILEQIAILKDYSAKNEKISKAITLKQQEIEKLKEYKTVLIDNVVTGKVKVS